jgi:hypothetical protein
VIGEQRGQATVKQRLGAFERQIGQGFGLARAAGLGGLGCGQRASTRMAASAGRSGLCWIIQVFPLRSGVMQRSAMPSASMV